MNSSSTLLVRSARIRGPRLADRAVHVGSAAIAVAVAFATFAPLLAATWSARHLSQVNAATVLAPLLKSIVLCVAAFAITCPLAVGCAVATVANPGTKAVRAALIATRFLAAVPGIVLSLCAALSAAVVGTWVAAVIALGLVAAPRLLWDLRRAIYRVPAAERATAAALGATESAIFLSIVLRRARYELAAAALRNASVCFGASACLLLIPWHSAEPLSVTVVQLSMVSVSSGTTAIPVLELLLMCAALQLAASTLVARRKL
jgi:ABC-type phosphate transport system permease subunit